LKPLIDAPFEGGPATWIEDLELEIQRRGFTEETHFTVAYSRVPDDSAPGGIGGVLATVHEITEKVVGERRIVILRDLGASAGDAKTAEEACAIVAATLARHPKDVPFADAAVSNLNGAIADSGACISSDPLPSVAIAAPHLQQVFQNLVGNAIKYRQPGIAPVVRISARRVKATGCSP
jgi:signal transduction histidine kinase